MSIVRRNLLTQKYYTPYCGNDWCRNMPRTFFNGTQFESEFIEEYKTKQLELPEPPLYVKLLG